jgi:hypothetical protein
MLNIRPVCWAGGGAYVAVQPVVLKLRWDLVAAISDLWVDRWCLGSAQHPPCQASGPEPHLQPDRNRSGSDPGSDPVPIPVQSGSDAVVILF